jgi:hypothetical protein
MQKIGVRNLAWSALSDGSAEAAPRPLGRFRGQPCLAAAYLFSEIDAPHFMFFRSTFNSASRQ